MTDTEWVDVVDEEDRVVGRARRSEIRRRNLLHRNVAVLCRNGRSEIYVQQRTQSKDLFPGLYDVFVGGVVNSGEDYAACAVRELHEELGIRGPLPNFLFMHRYEGPETRSHTAVYEVRWDGPIRHQESEVAWGGYRTRAEILQNPASWQFVPDGWEIFDKYCKNKAG